MHIYFELLNDVGHLIRVNADGLFLNMCKFFIYLDVIGDIALRALPLKIQGELLEKGYIMLMPMLNIVL